MIHKGKDMDSAHYYCDVFYYQKVKWWRCDNENFLNSEGIRIRSTINHGVTMKKSRILYV